MKVPTSLSHTGSLNVFHGAFLGLLFVFSSAASSCIAFTLSSLDSHLLSLTDFKYVVTHIFRISQRFVEQQKEHQFSATQ
jgi:hypothetical protein